MSEFHDEVDRKEAKRRIDALSDRPEDMHDYQDCAATGDAMVALPDLPDPIQSSKHWDRGVEWALAWERCARKEREDQYRSLTSLYHKHVLNAVETMVQLYEARAALRGIMDLFTESKFYIHKVRGGMTNAEQDRINEAFAAARNAVGEP